MAWSDRTEAAPFLALLLPSYADWRAAFSHIVGLHSTNPQTPPRCGRHSPSPSRPKHWFVALVPPCPALVDRHPAFAGQSFALADLRPALAALRLAFAAHRLLASVAFHPASDRHLALAALRLALAGHLLVLAVLRRVEDFVAKALPMEIDQGQQVVARQQIDQGR